MGDDEVDLLAAIDAVRGVEPVEEEEPEELVEPGITATTRGPSGRSYKVLDFDEAVALFGRPEPLDDQEEVWTAGDGDAAARAEARRSMDSLEAAAARGREERVQNERAKAALTPQVVKDLAKVAVQTGQSLAAVTDAAMKMSRAGIDFAEAQDLLKKQQQRKLNLSMLRVDSYETLLRQIKPRLLSKLSSLGLGVSWKLELETVYDVAREALVVAAVLTEYSAPLMPFIKTGGPAVFKEPQQENLYTAEASITREEIERTGDAARILADDLFFYLSKLLSNSRG